VVAVSFFLIVRDLGQRGFNKMTNGGRRREPFARSPLIAEKTAARATHRGKKKRDNQKGHWVLLESYDFGFLVLQFILLMSNVKIQISNQCQIPKFR